MNLLPIPKWDRGGNCRGEKRGEGSGGEWEWEYFSCLMGVFIIVLVAMWLVFPLV